MIFLLTGSLYSQAVQKPTKASASVGVTIISGLSLTLADHSNGDYALNTGETRIVLQGSCDIVLHTEQLSHSKREYITLTRDRPREFGFMLTQDTKVTIEYISY